MSGVRIPPPRPTPSGFATGEEVSLRVSAADSLLALLDGGCSSPGRAPDCGSGGSGFETRQPPHLPHSRANAGCALGLSVTRLCNVLKDGVVHNKSNLHAELRVPQDVRPVIGKTRFAKSTGTLNKCEAVLRAAPMLEQWQSDIELTKSDPQAPIANQA